MQKWKAWKSIARKLKFEHWLAIALTLGLLSIPAIAQFSKIAFLNQVFEEQVGLYTGAGYSSFFGDGKDGALALPATWTGGYKGFPTKPASINTIRSYLTAGASAGATSLSIATYTSAKFDLGSDSNNQIVVNGTGGTGFAGSVPSCSTPSNCQELLIMQMTGTNAGQYEFALLQTRSGATLTLYQGLRYTYTVALGSAAVQVMVVPRFTNVTFNSGGTLSVGAWDGNTGGVIAFRANGTVNMSNDITLGARYIAKIAAGYWQDNLGTAGYGFVGGNGVAPVNGVDAFDSAGASTTYDGKSVSPGTSNMLIMGGGGTGTAGNNGGAGGGIVIVKANILNLGGRIMAIGANGTGTGMGGASGSIYAAGATVGESAVGACPNTIAAPATTGGSAGSAGRSFLHFTSSLTTGCETAGTPSSVFTVRKANVK